MRRPSALIPVPVLVPVLAFLLCACGTQPMPTAPQRSEGGDAPTTPSEPTNATAPDLGGMDGLAAYGQEHSDEFGGLYIDPPGGRHVVILFTANLEEHARAVEAIHPGTTVRGVEHSEAELNAVLEGIDHEELLAGGVEMVSASVDVINNRVTLEAKSSDPTAEVRLELAFGGLVDVTIHPAPGEWHHVAEGDGWRLVGSGEVANGEAFTVRAATDAGEWEEMWRAIGLEGDRPRVDFEDEVAVSFGHGFGSTCREVRFDGVVVEVDLVHSLTSDPLAPRACTLDLAGAAVFVVAISRDELPDDRFTLRLGADRTTCADCGFAEEIEVTLP